MLVSRGNRLGIGKQRLVLQARCYATKPSDSYHDQAFTDYQTIAFRTHHAVLGIVIMFHSDDYISLFVPFVGIPVSLGRLLQRIGSINDRF